MSLLETIQALPPSAALYAFAGALVLLMVWIVRLEFRLKRLTCGKSGADLEEALTNLGRGQKELEQFKNEIERYLSHVEHRLSRSVRDVQTVRFNPFKGSGMGGDQSFATALLNEKGDGVILSSLYARDHVSMFAKPVENYRSTHELTDEERSVLDRARQSLLKK